MTGKPYSPVLILHRGLGMRVVAGYQPPFEVFSLSKLLKACKIAQSGFSSRKKGSESALTVIKSNGQCSSEGQKNLFSEGGLK